MIKDRQMSAAMKARRYHRDGTISYHPSRNGMMTTGQRGQSIIESQDPPPIQSVVDLKHLKDEADLQRHFKKRHDFMNPYSFKYVTGAIKKGHMPDREAFQTEGQYNRALNAWFRDPANRQKRKDLKTANRLDMENADARIEKWEREIRKYGDEEQTVSESEDAPIPVTLAADGSEITNHKIVRISGIVNTDDEEDYDNVILSYYNALPTVVDNELRRNFMGRSPYI